MKKVYHMHITCQVKRLRGRRATQQLIPCREPYMIPLAVNPDAHALAHTCDRRMFENSGMFIGEVERTAAESNELMTA
ncbi:hypothetical protein [Burkholderia territorii]|uniref:hypothetical protein n=1 Tax=Burkholderia territorii TaxID=1503055 RepID=UPI0012D8DDF9|nr:hypothetical protein [Burkholderia territorii]